MNEEDLKNLIKQYIKDNVRVEVEKEYVHWSTPAFYIIKLILEDEVISSDTVSA